MTKGMTMGRAPSGATGPVRAHVTLRGLLEGLAVGGFGVGEETVFGGRVRGARPTGRDAGVQG